ncbi:hypothetical protein V5O48_018995 [Marasmius crinis-equi]|uniref:Serine-threonine/tyrosine-protein kinase catalytic domain-containing protein n=1 Tax=Marasmius crinis-equi TaxID=585013 RepID=A0ABR3EJL3_9AGAR
MRSVAHFLMTSSTPQIFTGNPPFHELTDGAVIVAVVLRKKRPTRPENIAELTNSMWEFMVSCWAHEASLRPTAEDVLSQVGALRSLKTGERVKLQSAPDWKSLDLIQIREDVNPAVDTTALVRLLQKHTEIDVSPEATRAHARYSSDGMGHNENPLAAGTD